MDQADAWVPASRAGAAARLRPAHLTAMDEAAGSTPRPVLLGLMGRNDFRRNGGGVSRSENSGSWRLQDVRKTGESPAKSGRFRVRGQTCPSQHPETRLSGSRTGAFYEVSGGRSSSSSGWAASRSG